MLLCTITLVSFSLHSKLFSCEFIKLVHFDTCLSGLSPASPTPKLYFSRITPLKPLGCLFVLPASRQEKY